MNLHSAQISYFITNLAIENNTFTIRSTNAKLSDLKYPAMTICSKASNKFAIAERMGNYLNGNSKKLKQLLKIFAVSITFMSKYYAIWTSVREYIARTMQN